MNTRYYVLGSKYDVRPNYWVDVLPQMWEKGAVSVGWAKQYDLRSVYAPLSGCLTFTVFCNSVRASL